MSFDLSKPNRTIHAGVILMNSTTEILDVAPIDLLNGMTKEFLGSLPSNESVIDQALDIQFHWVNEHGSPARMTSGITIQATNSFATCPPLDIVLMGASDAHYQPNQAELAFVRKAYEQCSAFLNICGGFQTALQAGLLHEKTATSPRMILEQLRNAAPTTKWVERRWVRDEKIWTSGTLLNGLDLMREFAKQTWGNELVEYLLDIGGWPVRDVEYKDVDGKL